MNVFCVLFLCGDGGGGGVLFSSRVISQEAAEAEARDLGYVYVETSAKTGEKSKELFELIVESVDPTGFSSHGGLL